jgi:hypothetical protein
VFGANFCRSLVKASAVTNKRRIVDDGEEELMFNGIKALIRSTKRAELVFPEFQKQMTKISGRTASKKQKEAAAKNASRGACYFDC